MAWRHTPEERRPGVKSLDGYREFSPNVPDKATGLDGVTYKKTFFIITTVSTAGISLM
jgi:hypothetical protein